MASTAEKTMDKSQAMFADMNDRTKAAMEKSSKMVEEMNDFAKGNVEAMAESGRITAKGLESFGRDAAEYSRKSFETMTAAMKEMASAKSPTDFFKLQSDYVRSAFDSAVAEASKQSEAMLKLAGEASQPLSNRVAVAADKAKTVA
ncbi:phasin family protein [Stakelama saccharophila]|uniref:Phasin family protein n=1 Tax=Stakelama saccharophila TaxID=3075605 RepID=A0ABZ0BAJ4_9SPHN|nr:phasin family protein [Stakelama sp. W311]WNO54373.1 phasin family protein [Stakelama sp. W311]